MNELEHLLSQPYPDPNLHRLQATLVRRADEGGLLDIAYRTFATPAGVLLLAATPIGLVRVAYPSQNHDTVLADLAVRISPRILHAPDRLDIAAHQLEEYFTSERRAFDLPLDLQLVRGFRRTVLKYLPAIAYGQTITYAGLATEVGNPRAFRAVASACATNPLPLIIPCHRVIRSDSTFGEYVGGTDIKKYLLHLEQGT